MQSTSNRLSELYGSAYLAACGIGTEASRVAVSRPEDEFDVSASNAAACWPKVRPVATLVGLCVGAGCLFLD